MTCWSRSPAAPHAGRSGCVEHVEPDRVHLASFGTGQAVAGRVVGLAGPFHAEHAFGDDPRYLGDYSSIGPRLRADNAALRFLARAGSVQPAQPIIMCWVVSISYCAIATSLFCCRPSCFSPVPFPGALLEFARQAGTLPLEHSELYRRDGNRSIEARRSLFSQRGWDEPAASARSSAALRRR